MTPVCPSCSGPYIARHPTGLVAFDHTAQCVIRRAEDSTLVADTERVRDYPYGQFIRNGTEAERILLVAIGASVPASLVTSVQFTSPGIRRRAWPTVRPTGGTAA